MSTAPPPQRILLIRLTALGDVVLATPLLHALRHAFPEAQIDWLVNAAFAPLLAADPALSEVVPWRSGERAPLGQLRARRYEWVIDLQNKPRTALLRARLGARRVLALRKRSVAQALLALVGVERPPRLPHAVDLNLSVAREWGLTPVHSEPRVWTSAEGRAEAAVLLGESSTRRLWGLAPAARWMTKRWPPERWAALGRQAVDEGTDLLLLGGPGDAETLDTVRAQLGSAVAGDTLALSVAGLAAAIARCSLVISGDSGPAHLAAALGRPLVALFGPTAPSRWAPRAPTVRVLHRDLPCSPCSNHGSARCPIGTHACMAQIDVAQVLQAAQELT